MACNIFYELEKFCTSIITQDEQGKDYFFNVIIVLFEDIAVEFDI